MFENSPYLCVTKPKSMNSNTAKTNRFIGAAAYVNRELFRKNTPASVTPNGTIYRIVDGVQMTEEDFNKACPKLNVLKTHYYKGTTIGQNVPS